MECHRSSQLRKRPSRPEKKVTCFIGLKLRQWENRAYIVRLLGPLKKQRNTIQRCKFASVVSFDADGESWRVHYGEIYIQSVPCFAVIHEKSIVCELFITHTWIKNRSQTLNQMQTSVHHIRLHQTLVSVMTL